METSVIISDLQNGELQFWQLCLYAVPIKHVIYNLSGHIITIYVTYIKSPAGFALLSSNNTKYLIFMLLILILTVSLSSYHYNIYFFIQLIL